MMKLKDGSNVFFISDTHFGHNNIIKYCQRPFSSVEEMNEKLIENWNNTVNEDSIIFHLGDICLGGAATWSNVLPRLKGHIHLILGNHDIKNYREGYRQYFESVQEQLTVEIGKKTLILTHFPLLCYHGTWGTEMNVWNIHGHVHVCKDAKANSGKDYERMKLTFPTQYDAGVDLNSYTPISFDKLRRRIACQIEENSTELRWIDKISDES